MFRICVMTIVGLTLLVVVPALLQHYAYPTHEASISKDMSPLVKKVAKYVRPLNTVAGDRYCSSSSVNYKGNVFTVTNNHCCDFGLTQFGEGEVRVGNVIENVIHRSKIADVCILTSSQKDTPIKLAKNEFGVLDRALLMGYPRGEFLTPRYGHVIAKDIEVCIPYAELDDIVCVSSNFLSTISYGGNSGSPLLNEQGNITNVLYAGDLFIHTYSITVPYFYLRAALEEASNNVR